MYSPRIAPEQVKMLYLLKRAYAGMGIRKPMTRIVKEALAEYLPKISAEMQSTGNEVAPE